MLQIVPVFMVAMMIVFLYFADDQIESRSIYYYVSIT